MTSRPLNPGQTLKAFVYVIPFECGHPRFSLHGPRVHSQHTSSSDATFTLPLPLSVLCNAALKRKKARTNIEPKRKRKGTSGVHILPIPRSDRYIRSNTSQSSPKYSTDIIPPTSTSIFRQRVRVGPAIPIPISFLYTFATQLPLEDTFLLRIHLYSYRVTSYHYQPTTNTASLPTSRYLQECLFASQSPSVTHYLIFA